MRIPINTGINVRKFSVAIHEPVSKDQFWSFYEAYHNDPDCLYGIDYVVRLTPKTDDSPTGYAVYITEARRDKIAAQSKIEYDHRNSIKKEVELDFGESASVDGYRKHILPAMMRD